MLFFIGLFIGAAATALGFYERGRAKEIPAISLSPIMLAEIREAVHREYTVIAAREQNRILKREASRDAEVPQRMAEAAGRVAAQFAEQRGRAILSRS